MAAIISEKFRIFNAKQFLESLSEAEKTNMYFFVGRSSKWDVYLEIHGVAGTFQVGETVTAGGWSATVAAVYDNSLLCTTVLPTATTTPAYGTTVTGGTSSATATSGTYRYATEEIPPLPLDNQIEKNAIYDEIIAAKRINSDAARLCVPRYNWTPSVNPKFDMYRPNYSPTPGGGGSIGIQTATGQNQLTSAKFYVMNSQYEVFKCLYNGQSPANPTGVNVTDEPKSNPTAGQGTFANGVFTEENGNYIWKHMFTLPTGDVLAFLSTDFMPIAASTDSSRTAVEGLAVDGAVHVAVVSLAGSGLPASNDYYAKIIGDGTGGIVKFSTDGSGTITGASIQAAGNGYTYANVLLEQGNVYTDAACTTTATVAASAVGSIEAVISPEGGHGSNADVELFAKRVMTNVRLTYAEGQGDFPVDNDFRRIGIIQDPFKWGQVGTVQDDLTVRGTYAVKLNNATADYVADEIISQTVTGGTAKGTVVSWDSTNGILKYYQSPDIHCHSGKVYAFESDAANAVVGATSTASGTVDTAQTTVLSDITFDASNGGLAYPEIEPNSGDIVYIENRRQITRAPDQIEDIKLVIEF